MNQQNNRDDGGNNNLPGGMGGGNMRRWFWLILPLLLLLPLITTMFSGGGGETISYTEFKNQIEQGNVQKVTIAGNRVQGVLKQPIQSNSNGLLSQGNQFTTYVPSFGNDNILQLLQDKNVTIYTRPPQDNISFLGVLFNLLPFLLLIWIGFSVYRNMRSQGRGIFNVGENKAKLYEKTTKVKATFDDVAGLEGSKDEVKEIVDYLKNPKRYEKLGAKTPKGVLLVGPPGTGKTLLARAIAGEADAPFYSMSGSDFMEMFVGVGASRVRNLFKDARKRQPSIIFIDELDSIGRHRGAGLGGGHDEREQTLNQMLAELDGFEPTESVIVLAATNRPDILDPALLRPGRFDRRVTTNLPSVKDRVAILGIHSKNKPLADDVDMQQVARSTPGFSGADLQNLLNEASLLAARKEQDKIFAKDISESRDKILLGLERKNLTISEDERKIVAFHESGHAITAAMLPHTDPLLKVTIIPRENSMGVTQQMPEEEKYLYSREYLSDRIAVMLGGRASEDLVFGSFTNGAQNDLQQATRLARKMVSDWGMSPKIGPFSAGGEKQNVFLGEELSKRKDYSETTAREIDEEIFSILNTAYSTARSTLEKNREKLDNMANALLEKEELSAEDIKKIVDLNETDNKEKKSSASDRGSSSKKSSGSDGSGD